MSAPATGGLLVSVIVPARNAGDDLEELVAALSEQTVGLPHLELVIGDDGSTDGSTDDLTAAGGWIRIVRGPPQNSYAARNRAVDASRGPVLAFCDADCLPERDWLERGLHALGSADLVAGRIRFEVPVHRTIWTLLDMDAFKDHELQVRQGTAETANLFVRRELFDRMGGFDETLPEHGDFDFSLRCVAAGYRLAFGRDTLVRHPTRNSARPFLRAAWIYNRWYAVRESRARRLPEGLKLRSWVPFVQPIRARRRWGRSLGPDRQWLAQQDVVPTTGETLLALPLMYVLMPYLGGVAQLKGWWEGRQLR
jgi:glycosyltransferase involved in cell wall biosynthesis